MYNAEMFDALSNNDSNVKNKAADKIIKKYKKVILLSIITKYKKVILLSSIKEIQLTFS